MLGCMAGLRNLEAIFDVSGLRLLPFRVEKIPSIRVEGLRMCGLEPDGTKWGSARGEGRQRVRATLFHLGHVELVMLLYFEFGERDVILIGRAFKVALLALDAFNHHLLFVQIFVVPLHVMIPHVRPTQCIEVI